MKSALQNLKSLLSVGAAVAVTNHYITREDHPCFGTNVRVVSKVNSASWYYEASPWPLKWPKASEVVEVEPNVFDIYGHPHDGDLYMTIKVAQPS